MVTRSPLYTVCQAVAKWPFFIVFPLPRSCFLVSVPVSIWTFQCIIWWVQHERSVDRQIHHHQLLLYSSMLEGVQYMVFDHMIVCIPIRAETSSWACFSPENANFTCTALAGNSVWRGERLKDFPTFLLQGPAWGLKDCPQPSKGQFHLSCFQCTRHPAQACLVSGIEAQHLSYQELDHLFRTFWQMEHCY